MQAVAQGPLDRAVAGSLLLGAHGFAGFLWYAVDLWFGFAMGVIGRLCPIPSWLWMERRLTAITRWKDERLMAWWLNGLPLPDGEDQGPHSSPQGELAR